MSTLSVQDGFLCILLLFHIGWTVVYIRQYGARGKAGEVYDWLHDMMPLLARIRNDILTLQTALKEPRVVQTTIGRRSHWLFFLAGLAVGSTVGALLLHMFNSYR